VPPARRARDRRHGRVHPVAERSGRERVALAKVREDKERESSSGFDGTWVAHPDLVPVATEVFDAVLGTRPNQVDRLREDVVPDEAALLSIPDTPARSRRRGCTRTSRLGSATWTRGCKASGRRRSTT